ncbi:putative reverse transcriptase zinc-binding domain-containing protein [Helianthus annuus]|nr:putative reverse transcriptase zinc-binding domain-containing protein [Helianthus annuus]
MANLLNCGVGSMPFSYLGIPIGANMKHAKHWQPVVDKFTKKLSSWKARNLSFAGRVTLAKSVLGSLPSYYLSLFHAPRVVINKLERLRRDFVWGKSGMGQKLRWIKWEKILKPKDFGGIGIGGIRDFNLAMISKWWWRFKDDPNQLWAKVVYSIHYSKSENKLIPGKASMPGVWKDIGSVDKILANIGIQIHDKLKVAVGDGSSVRFWKDKWLTQEPLMLRFPNLFRLAKIKNSSVKACYLRVGDGVRWGWDWLRDPDTLEDWQSLEDLMRLLQDATIKGGKDKWSWENKYGVDFSTKGLRLDIVAVGEEPGDTGNLVRFAWNPWAPNKCNYLLWRALMGRVASKMGLSNRGIQLPNVTCDRCGLEEETSDHIFATCLFARSIWWQVFAWIKVPLPQNITCLQQIIDAIHQSPGSKRWRRLVYTVALATTWRIWHARNTKTFEGNFIPIRKSVDWIKEDAFI